ncbi:hypothetical protein GCM10009637_16610 [Brevibacterium luteolum]
MNSATETFTASAYVTRHMLGHRLLLRPRGDVVGASNDLESRYSAVDGVGERGEEGDLGAG